MSQVQMPLYGHCTRLSVKLKNLFLCRPSYNKVFQKTVPTQDVTNPVTISSVYRTPDIAFLHDSMLILQFSRDRGPTYFLHPSPAHFKTSQVFLIYLPACQSFSTIQIYSQNVALY